MSIELARCILNYLYEKNMGFVFLEDGQLIDREYCLNIINEQMEAV